MLLKGPTKQGPRLRRIVLLGFLFTASPATAATLDAALGEYPELPESKAMAVSFSDQPTAFNVSDQASDIAAAVAALGECEGARLRRGADQPCEIFRLNDATASRSADIKAGVEAGHRLFMWRYENGPTRLYLAGSIHVLKAALHPLPVQIEAAFREADHIVVEVDIVNLDPAATAQAFAKFALLPEGARVDQQLNAAQRDRLHDELRRLGLGIVDVARFKPMFLASQLSVTRLATFGYLPNYGVEGHFLSRLGERTVHQLETLEQQLAALAAPPMADQVEMLANTLDEMSETEPMAAEMVRAWFLGDDGELMRLFERYMAGSDASRALLETLIYERNLTMAAGIEELLGKPGTWLVLVGAGHLPGPRGIVALLNARGAKGHRIMSNEMPP